MRFWLALTCLVMVAAPAAAGLKAPQEVAVDPDDAGLEVTWAEVPGASGYHVYAGEAADELKRITQVPWTGTKLKIKGSQDKDIIVFVRAVDGQGREGPESEAAAYFPAKRPPTATPEPTVAATETPPATPTPRATPTPAQLVAPDRPSLTPADGGISLTWNIIPGALSYNLYVNTAPSESDAVYARMNTSPVKTANFVCQIPSGSDFRICVAAVDASGKEGPKSKEAHLKVK